jgi:hypothetical protein
VFSSDLWKYGAIKRPEVLEHPCLVAWKDLPEEQRTKDELFLAIVRVLAGKLAVSRPIPLPEEATDPGGGRKDDTREVGILTADGNVVKGGEIVPEVKTKKSKKKSFLGE